MPNILVVVDSTGWALGNLYGPLASIPDVVVAPISDIMVGTVRPAEFDLVHFTYWQHFIEFSQECERTVVSVHHLIRERVDTVLAELVMRHPDAIVVSDGPRLCLFGEMGIPVHVIPYGIDKTRHSERTLERDRFTVGWLGREWNTQEYKRFRAIREAACRAEVDYVDGGHVIGQPVKYENTDDFFMAIDAYIVASFIDAGPLPALEALSRGIPVLTTPVGMMPLVVEHGENGLFHDGSVDGMVEAFQRLRLLNRELNRPVSHDRVPDVATWIAQHAALYAEVLA